MTHEERAKLYGSSPTPAQRRRLKHKEHSSKAHSHEGLPLIVAEDGTVRRARCSCCSPQKKGIWIGGGQ
jgi:hypothetical protein